MRDIKFRAWDKECRNWIYADPVYGFFPSIHIEYETGKNLDDHYGTIQQFTGLTDKNGKEIYEGDIVKHRILNHPHDGILYGLQETFMDDPRQVTFEFGGFTPLQGWTHEALKDMQWEVIGNIYENPELLNAQSKSDAPHQIPAPPSSL
jgi:uncharacterized phage protein (TIGR01671 family)